MNPAPKQDFNGEARREWPINDLSFMKTVIEKGQAGILKELLAQGADPGTELPGGVTSLMCAVTLGEKEIVEVLTSDPRIAGVLNQKSVSFGRRTPLHMAVLYRRGDIAKVLVEAGAHINVQDEYGRSPLHYAAQLGLSHLVKMLAEAGADLNKVTDREGQTPLFDALCCEGPVFTQLIALGANPLAVDHNKKSIVHMAAQYDRPDAVEIAFRHGADLNAVNQDGHTPYDLAEWHRCPKVKQKITELLAEKGEKPKLTPGKNFNWGGGTFV